MSVRGRILILLLVFSPVILEESRLLLLWSSADWTTPKFIAGELVSSAANGTAPNGSTWSARRSSGSGGCNTDLSIFDSSGKKLEWWANSDSGYPKILVSESPGKTRFLCYQNYWTGSNHLIYENPSMIRYGVFLVEPGPNGYRLRPLVRNPISLIAREPLFLLVVLEQMISFIEGLIVAIEFSDA